ncbi:unnamed protein product [Microthlaspi erraticum]|uniref:Clp R domain-containing protein n=1 Tax=Microthlaspi erraticum TaxID=1685480 RepID=A0A6D2L4W8_9BRAS|nr:unnamed protein product [Microthlaspi erraticum]
MATFLATSTACPLLCPAKPTRSVKMMSSLQQASVLRIQSFSGLRASNALGLTARLVQGLFSKVNRSISSKKGRASRSVTKAMFERFTLEAIKVITLSQEEALRHGHNFVGTEQILLGLVGEGTGIAAKALKSMGINLKDARVEVEKIIGRGSGFVVAVEIPFTPRAKRVLELSLAEARQLGHNYINTEHLLLGLVREDGVAARVLENLGVEPSNIRTRVIRMVSEENNEVTAKVDLENLRKEVEKIFGRGNGSAKGVAASVLEDLGVVRTYIRDKVNGEEMEVPAGNVDLEQLSQDVETIFGRGNESAKGVAARVLQDLGVDRTYIRNKLIRMIEEDKKNSGDQDEQIDNDNFTRIVMILLLLILLKQK